jgi:hypothetical protein
MGRFKTDRIREMQSALKEEKRKSDEKQMTQKDHWEMEKMRKDPRTKQIVQAIESKPKRVPQKKG